MATQKGILKVKGTIGGITFYQTSDGYLVREKGGVDPSRIKKDPRFARTRENMEEFKSAAKAGKLLRDSVRGLMAYASDKRVTARLTQIMSHVLKHDTINFRGRRVPVQGLTTTDGRGLLNGFNFNNASVLGAVLFKQWTLNTATGVISIADFNPMEHLAVPEGATHFSICGAMEMIDFDTRIWDVKLTNIVNAAIANVVSQIALTPVSLPTGTGIKLFYLKIEFFQMVNTMQYQLRNGMFNVLSIIEVE